MFHSTFYTEPAAINVKEPTVQDLQPPPPSYYSNTTMEQEPENRKDLLYFAVYFGLSQLLGVSCIALVWVWMGQYAGGFAWQSNPKLQFNYHPVFMVIGLIFLYGDAILVYRVLRASAKLKLKLVHGALHTLAFIFMVIALKAVFDSHNLPAKPFPNLYSLHSWLGLTTSILFSLQFFFGFTAFLVPGVARSLRSRYLPIHVFFGVAIFGMAIASCLTGMTEKLMFFGQEPGNPYSSRKEPSNIANCLGLCVVAFGLVVAYLVTRPQYKRRPLPEEAALDLTTHSFN